MTERELMVLETEHMTDWLDYAITAEKIVIKQLEEGLKDTIEADVLSRINELLGNHKKHLGRKESEKKIFDLLSSVVKKTEQ